MYSLSLRIDMIYFIKHTLISLAVAIGIGVVIYALLDYFGESDAAFLGLLTSFSIIIGWLASPQKNISLGIRKLWTFDWVVIIAVAGAGCFMPPTYPPIVRIIVFFSYLVAMTSGAIVSRRLNQ